MDIDTKICISNIITSCKLGDISIEDAEKEILTILFPNAINYLKINIEKC